jgi:hypothetical protein
MNVIEEEATRCPSLRDNRKTSARERGDRALRAQTEHERNLLPLDERIPGSPAAKF